MSHLAIAALHAMAVFFILLGILQGWRTLYLDARSRLDNGQAEIHTVLACVEVAIGVFCWLFAPS